MKGRISKQARTNAISVIVSRTHPEYDTLSDEDKLKVIQELYDWIFEEGLKQITDIILMMEAMSEKEGEE